MNARSHEILVTRNPALLHSRNTRSMHNRYVVALRLGIGWHVRYIMCLLIEVRNGNLHIHATSMQSSTRRFLFMSSLGISTMSLITGAGLDLVVLPFYTPMSVPKISSALLISSRVTGLFLTPFDITSILRSRVDGVPAEQRNSRAAWALARCLGV